MFPMKLQLAPPLTVVNKPLSGPLSRAKLLLIPVDAKRVCRVGSRAIGLKAIEVIDSDGKSSISGVQKGLLLLPLVVFQIPPLGDPMKTMSGLIGSTAMA